MNDSLLKYIVLENYYIASKVVYEPILCECLNSSSKMIELSGGRFSLVLEQNNKQPDVRAENTGYEIDFKMAIAESYKEFLSRTAPIIQEIAPGVKAFCPQPKLTKKVLLLWNCCRNMSEEKLHQLRSQNDMESKNVCHFFDKVINCSKNILLYLPICFETVREDLTAEEQIETIFRELSDTTQFIFEFRANQQSVFDTYLVYLVRTSKNSQYFVISKFTESGLYYIDNVDMFSLESISKLRANNTLF